MSVNIFHKTGSGTGTLQKVAGNTVILDANVSEVRQATVNVPVISADSSEPVSVTFSTPMPDTDYVVAFDSGSSAAIYIANTKATTGFSLRASNTRNENLPAHTVHYYAFKPIPMDGYTELQNKVNNPDSAPTSLSQNLVTSGGVFEALKDAGTVFTGTKAEWENLDPTEQERYEVVCITDDEESGLVDEYSTTEIKTNKVWIDGKPIYRKCWDLTITNYSDSGIRRAHTSNVLETGVTFISAIGGMYAALQNNSGTLVHTNWFPITNIIASTSMTENCNAGCGVSPSGDLTVSVASVTSLDWQEAYAKVWIEYTK